MNPKTTKENQTHSDEEPYNVNKILYNIKKATKDKTEDDIIKTIKTEIDLSENDLQVWNRMIDTISRMTLSKCIILSDYLSLLLFLSFNNLRAVQRFYYNRW